MKKYLKFLTAAVLTCSIVVISACSDDEGGGKSEIPAALIKSLTSNYDAGDFIETYEFTYDNSDRLTRIDVTNNDGGDYYYEYDYSVAGKLTETEVYEVGVEEYETVYDLDSEGRITKQYRDNPADYNAFTYDADGYLVEYREVRGGNVNFKETATIDDDNIIVHSRFGNGTVLSRTKTFTYLSNATALNVSNLPQANLINNERKSVSGFYGKGSRKLADFLELDYVGAPADYAKNTNSYTFNDDNQVLTITRSGRDVNNENTGLNEVFTYTYYPIEK